MKYNYEVKEITKEQCLQMVQKYHYSNTLPRLNKHFLGFFVGGVLVGVITLGWGTRPRHTIKKLFPTLETKDYFEIGRMCMTDEMPRNSESQMLSACVKWLKRNCPEVKILFTWADGMLGKCGYVYQASNFIYTGFVGGEFYLKDGVKIHVRSMKQILCNDSRNDKRLTVRPTLEQMRELNIRHYKGKQYRYIYFLCSRTEQKRLKDSCLEPLDLARPKDKDLEWRVKDIDSGKWVKCDKPKYVSDLTKKYIDSFTAVENDYEQMTIFSYIS